MKPGGAASAGAPEKAAAVAVGSKAGGGQSANGLSWEGRMGLAHVLVERAGGDFTAFSEEQVEHSEPALRPRTLPCNSGLFLRWNREFVH
jgi:hypothetical protein